MALRFRGLDAPIECVYHKDSGAAPTPTDPYEQAAAQYGLSTGTADYNAGLNRTNNQNAIGGSTWTTNQGMPAYGPVAPGANGTGTGAYSAGGNPGVTINGSAGQGTPQTSPGNGNATTNFGLGNLQNPAGAGGTINYAPTAGITGGNAYSLGGLMQTPPTYTNTTTLAPQFQDALQQPINTSGIAGMPGGPSTTQDLLNTQRSLYNQQMAYIQPQEDLANEQLSSQLANSGATPGSAAYNNATDAQNRANTFTNNQAINSAIQGGGAEQSRLFGLGSQSLQNQITARDAPINEYNSLQGGAGANATAQTPDISGAFNQQYQGALAGYNANTATNNADTSAAGSLLGTYLMYLALA